MSSQPQIEYQFGDFVLNPAERQLLHKGQPVSLPPKVFDTLVLLVENSGRLVSKDDFLKEIWPETFVEEVVLAHTVSQLRKALQQYTDAKLIETVPKRGYRFIAEVTQMDRSVKRETAEAITERETEFSNESK